MKRRDFLRLGLTGAAGALVQTAHRPPVARVNGGINVSPLRRLETNTGFTPPLIIPKLVDLQMKLVYELGFEQLRTTISFENFGANFLAAIPYVRAPARSGRCGGYRGPIRWRRARSSHHQRRHAGRSARNLRAHLWRLRSCGFGEHRSAEALLGTTRAVGRRRSRSSSRPAGFRGRVVPPGCCARARWVSSITEAGFDQTRSRAGGAAIWSISNLELVGRAFFDRVQGRVERTEGRADVRAAFRFAQYFVATARTSQEWQPGVERFLRDHRVGLTFFGRRFRFARSSESAEAVLPLTRRANELGYNERRVYDIDGLRALRERLSLSPAGVELADSIDALYLAEIRERNVPQLGFEVAQTTDELTGSESNAYSVFIAGPWRLAWPFSRGEARTEFARLEWVTRDQRFPSLGMEDALARAHRNRRAQPAAHPPCPLGEPSSDAQRVGVSHPAWAAMER